MKGFELLETWAAYNERTPGGFNAAEAGFSLHSLKLLDIITTAHDAVAAGFTDLAELKKEELLEGASAQGGVFWGESPCSEQISSKRGLSLASSFARALMFRT